MAPTGTSLTAWYPSILSWGGLMEAAQPGLGNYAEPPDGGYSSQDSSYWFGIVSDHALRATGIHEFGKEARAATPTPCCTRRGTT
jgi:hypothetical protein